MERYQFHMPMINTYLKNQYFDSNGCDILRGKNAELNANNPKKIADIPEKLSIFQKRA